MKKILAVLMALAISLTCMVTALAEDTTVVYDTNHKPGEKIEIPLDYEGIDNSDLRVSNALTSGKDAISSIEIKNDNLVITLKNTYGTKAVNVKGDLQLRATGRLVDTLKFDFDIAWDEATVADVADLDVTLDNATPVYKFAAANKSAIFSVPGTDAFYTVRLESQGAVNMYFETTAIKSVVQANEDAELYFIRFNGAPEFDFNGEFNYYVDNEKDWFLYEVNAEGKLLKTGATYDKEEGVLVLKTKTLTSYVISDTALDTVTPSSGSSTPADTSKGSNPNTGAVDFVNVAVALAVVSLAAAGAVALKKVK